MGIKGRIHSIETMGTLDGPGIRFVIFTQGCPLRCAYCHNPDTWDPLGGFVIDVEEIFNKILRYKTYMDFSGGGVTLSGGEPTLQPDFAAELFKRCKNAGINTALDTSGYCEQKDLAKILPYTDLVLFDVKHPNQKEHIKLTGKDNEKIIQNLSFIDSMGVKIWIRYVLVPGITDSPELIKKLADFLTLFRSIEKVEILPYHNLGVHKWKALGLNYPLSKINPPSAEDIKKSKKILLDRGLKVS
ncbi:MAG: pyruvate formate-lyase-activating protein [Thermovenabulum sp.]|uniref:pyruvate formate-lyase-activating protein n=1 Tax=Thermovenabulum sp. TaxID=3100335 RepID=UPI003C7AE659